MPRVESQSVTNLPQRANAAPQAVSGAKPMPAMAQDANSAATPRDASDFARFQQDQNDGHAGANACGTTSLSMLMSFWRNNPQAFTHDKIDPAIREWGTFTTPHEIASYAEAQGFRASTHNNSSLNDLKGLLDKGVPVQVLIDPKGTGNTLCLHYVDVVGYESDAKGNITAVKIANPENPAGSPPETMPIAEFEHKWGNLKLKGISTGLNNLMITVLPKDNVSIKGPDGVVRQSKDIALPKGNNLGWKVWLVDRAMNLKNHVAHIGHDIKSAAKSVWHALTSL